MRPDLDGRRRNPERDQDRAEDLLDNWRKYKYVMFPQQKAIYKGLYNWLTGRDRVGVIEAGCGAGVGGALLARAAERNRGTYLGTDKLSVNVGFAAELYPWAAWCVWDLREWWDGPPADVVVCVEAVEHVGDQMAALRHLLAAAVNHLWFSVPNGRDKKCPPENPEHTAEYTPKEMKALLREAGPWGTLEIYDCDFNIVDSDTDADPLVYHVIS